MIVYDTSNNSSLSKKSSNWLMVEDGKTTDILEDESMSDEPGSPIFHDAIMFSSQVQLNDLFRDRRGGLHR